MSGPHTRRSTFESSEGSETEEFHHVVPVGIPRYDVVHEIEDDEDIPVQHYHDDRQYVTEIEINSLRGSTTGSNVVRPRKETSETNEEEPHHHHHHHEEREVHVGAVTVGNVVNTRSAGSVSSTARRFSSKKDSAPSIPLPIHPAQQQYEEAQQEVPPQPPTQLAEPKKPKSPPNPDMEFDFNGKAIEPILQHRMNLDDRDEHDQASYLKTSFFTVFQEPSEEYHSIACVWTLSFKIFEIVRIYTYKILSLIFGLLIALLTGFLFAVFAFLNIWIIRPALHLVRAALSQILFIWPVFLMYVVRPWFYACGAILSTARLHISKGDQVTEVWERHVRHV